VSIKDSEKVATVPEGAVMVAVQVHPLPYGREPAPAWDVKVPGEEKEPRGPPQEPPGTSTLAAGALVWEGVGVAVADQRVPGKSTKAVKPLPVTEPSVENRTVK
jgi:hypothetical protein